MSAPATFLNPLEARATQILTSAASFYWACSKPSQMSCHFRMLTSERCFSFTSDRDTFFLFWAQRWTKQKKNLCKCQARPHSWWRTSVVSVYSLPLPPHWFLKFHRHLLVLFIGQHSCPQQNSKGCHVTGVWDTQHRGDRSVGFWFPPNKCLILCTSVWLILSMVFLVYF